MAGWHGPIRVAADHAMALRPVHCAVAFNFFRERSAGRSAGQGRGPWRHSKAPASAGLTRPLWRRLLDSAFGYDFFISYAWTDGGPYAEALVAKLEENGYEVFLDRQDYRSGDDWKQVGAWTLRRTGQLVLIGSPAAMTSAPVAREVEIFAQTGRRIIPIDFGGSLEAGLEAAPFCHRLPPELIRIRESKDCLGASPSDEAVSALRRTFDLTRQDTKRIRILTCVAAALAVLLICAAAAAIIALWQTSVARGNAADAQVASLRLLSQNGEYDAAADLAAKNASTDPRIAFASAVLEQHRSLPVRFGQGKLKDGIFSLAFDPRRRMLFGAGHGELGLFDPLSGNLLRRERTRYQTNVNNPVSVIGTPGSILRIAREPVTPFRFVALVCAPDAKQMNCRAIASDINLATLKWFDRTNTGVALDEDRVVVVSLDRDRLVKGRAIASGIASLETPPASMPVFAFRGYGAARKLAGTVVPAEQGAAFRSWDAPPASVTRVLSGGATAFLDERDQLVIGDPSWSGTATTREVGYKPWLAFVERDGGTLFVQEPYDLGLATGSRIAVLDIRTGHDAMSPFSADEPIWAYAADPTSGRRYFAGQHGRVEVVDAGAARVRVLAIPSASVGPMLLRGEQLRVRTSNAIDRDGWRIDLASRKFRGFTYNPAVVHEFVDGFASRSQECPFGCEVSPNGSRLAVVGDGLTIVRVKPGGASSSLADLAQSALNDDALVEWLPNTESEGSPIAARWLSDDLLLTDNYHGHALVWNVARRTYARVDLKGDAVTGISWRGPILVWSAAGNVYTIDANGTPSLYAKVPGALNLFPLDTAERHFIATMQNPSRTAFLFRQGTKLEEVASVREEQKLQDVISTNNTIYLLYATSIRIYRAPSW